MGTHCRTAAQGGSMNAKIQAGPEAKKGGQSTLN